jgi:site-specific DNA-methyltransferase (adenine-specific)/modification methylase
MNAPVVIGNATLYCGDCREILPTLPKVDAVVTDPPYGQRLNTNVTGKRVTGRSLGSGRPYQIHDKRRKTAAGIHSTGMARMFPAGIVGDDQPFDPSALLELSDRVLLWGAHKFGDRLPRGRWLAWDKVPTGKIRDQGDGELAWTNVNPDKPMRIFRLLWDGVCVGSAARHEVTSGARRVHPTQKPEALMEWCLQFVDLAPQSIVCDPYMGAGSTGVAAARAGHAFVGAEIEREYFDIACERIDQAQKQQRMFA